MIGNLPDGYDRAQHGPYDPARYYGKPDTPFAEVKLGELQAWVSRRDVGPRQFAGLCSRAFWRWQHMFLFPRRAGLASLFQVACATSVIFYILNYKRIRGHRSYKYH